MDKKGFTLVELLTVIILLGIIAIITTPVVINIIKESKEHAFSSQQKIVTKAAERWGVDNVGLLPKGTNKCFISTQKLADFGYLSKGEINNFKNNTPSGAVVEISYDPNNNQYIYEYKESSSLSACASGDSSGSGGLFNGTIYRSNNNKVNINDTLDKCGSYVQNASALHQTYYLKHTINNNVVTESYVCFLYNGTEHCLKGGDGGASFAANTSLIQAYQTYYGLGSYEYNGGNQRGCRFNSLDSYCYSGDFRVVRAESNGMAYVYLTSTKYCSIETNGSSACYV